MTTTTNTPSTRSPRLALARHFAEMLVAMFAGMIVFGEARHLLGWTVEMADRPGASYLLMATDMALGMAIWMLLRGHPVGCTVEMCAAMYLPAVLLPLVWGGLLGHMGFMVAAHVLMVLAMLAVLLRHRREYV